ncbi:MAG: DEAD/DEAH box helicase [Micromonosporaceae bacterium]|nr:DEAD/DEAH box helicase [Micromonosporaceae bacterium]
MAGSVADVLDRLYVVSTSLRDQGDRFERMMVQFFKTDAEWSQRFTEVWQWMDWPDRPPHGDHGIDLVARERDTGDLVAIQCKFYDQNTTISKHHIDSFLAESGKEPYRSRMIVTTTDHWGPNAEEALAGQQIPVTRLRFRDLAESSIDWSQFDVATPEIMELKERKRLREHQVQAIAKVREGLSTHDRGKLIMACGTGKTFTSLKLAEQLVPLGGRVLFLVPSIALLSQTLREWSIEAEVSLRAFAVCSDIKVGAGKARREAAAEDISVVDLALPATTDPARLNAKLANPDAGLGRMTVVFSTYQSIDVVARAQQMGLPDFDLIICDEAHRTTGVTLAGQDESTFVRVHDGDYLRATKRLYMTATPRIYDDASKAKAGQANAVLASMDDEKVFGPELHRLGFGEAVTRGLLSDYKVLVLAVNEEQVSKTFQQQLADKDCELRLDDVAKIVGCWNGLAKRGQAEHDFGTDPAPMTTAVAFAGTIANSKKFAAMFQRVVSDYIDAHRIAHPTDPETNGDAAGGEPAGSLAEALHCEVDHVDGTYNVLLRNEKLDWLKAAPTPGRCRVLSNARCLAEGVDVPALDAVMFLNPRKSTVDVVQSVGRVMRLADGKQYGYIILPIGIPSGLSPEEALRDNSRYQVVWEVLQALRAHDERFNAMVNKIELNKARDERVQIIGVGTYDADADRTGNSKASPAAVQQQLPLEWLDEWREAIYARIVAKVGSRRYWDQWASDVAGIAERHTTRIKALLADPTSRTAREFEEFLGGLRGNLNASITADDAVDMLAQHLITRPVFEALFDGYSFAEHNPVSRVMQAMLDVLDAHNVDAEAESLDQFYASVRMRAEGIDNATGKQKIITELYEKFFKLAFPRMADKLGIVYTPVEIVDFIIRSVDEILREEFAASLSDEGVHVLDPFTGTGTFIVRVLESGRIRPDDLGRKYASELHANEILLLAYYIAAINIEATYHGLAAQQDPEAGYTPFDGIVLTDTFQMTEKDDFDDETVFPTNNDRVVRQRDLDIRVILGNPPYSVGQTSANDNNANLKYPTLDTSIQTTYAVRGTAANKNALYDSYIRAIRWASDRIKNQGVIGFVTNGGFLDANTADGLRLSLADEFTSIYILNLRGNQRTAGELSRREGGKIFGAGSRNTVAITLLVKNPARSSPATIRYRDIGDYLTREEKLAAVADATLTGVDWQEVTPNAAGDWISQRNDAFAAFTPISSKGGGSGIFATHSRGLETGRDAWVYGYSLAALRDTVTSMADTYNTETERFAEFCRTTAVANPKSIIKDFVNSDPSRISWSSSLLSKVTAGVHATVHDDGFRLTAYRPFNRQYAYFDGLLNHRVRESI